MPPPGPARSRIVCGVLLLVLSGLLFASGASAASKRASAPRASKTVVIGALLDLSAGWTALGNESLVALRRSVADANRSLRQQGSAKRVRLLVADVAGSPSLAAQELAHLAALGARIVIGPEASSEVQAVRALANRLGVLVVSQGSTASSLAISGDMVLRLVPDDVQEAAAVTSLLTRDGVVGIVPIWREDAGNAGLVASLRSGFAGPSTTVGAGVSYPTAVPDFAAAVAALSSQVSQMIAQVGAEKAAVYLAGFDEVVGVLGLAAADPVLKNVRWYGSDGVALSPALIANSAAAAFAVAAGYPSPILGLDAVAEARSAALRAFIESRTGTPADAFGLAAYDALRLGVQAVIAANGRGPAALRRAFVRHANGYEGMSGRIVLNAAGDRAFGSFDFWAVCPLAPAGGFQWVRTASFLSSAPGQGTIVAREACSS
jgi:branched-chain amino acid transport system substrate-binding protein